MPRIELSVLRSGTRAELSVLHPARQKLMFETR